MDTTTISQRLTVRAIEACTSFMTSEPLDMAYFRPLVERAAEQGINALTLFIIPDSYYPETASKKKWEYEVGLDWPSKAFPHYRNAHCPNAQNETEYVPELIHLCHALGVKVYLRPITNKHKWLFPEHDAWQALSYSEDGTETLSSACSWDNEEFMEYYHAILGELVRRYAADASGADGIILDQEKCFGVYSGDKTRRRFRERMGCELTPDRINELRDYWSNRNADRVKASVAFCKTINPRLHMGVTLEGLRREQFDSGSGGRKHVYFNAGTTQVDFMHHQIIGEHHTDEHCLHMWERLTNDGPLWIMLDPLADDAGWAEAYWSWKPRTPAMIHEQVQRVKRLRGQLTHPERLFAISEFPVTRLPLDHPNLAAVLEAVGNA